jgi:hypothetical protein
VTRRPTAVTFLKGMESLKTSTKSLLTQGIEKIRAAPSAALMFHNDWKDSLLESLATLEVATELVEYLTKGETLAELGMTKDERAAVKRQLHSLAKKLRALRAKK